MKEQKSNKSEAAICQSKFQRRVRFVPCTPGGSILMDIASDTKQGAWDNLLEAASHMPYDGLQGFKKRGYSIVQI